MYDFHGWDWRGDEPPRPLRMLLACICIAVISIAAVLLIVSA